MNYYHQLASLIKEGMKEIKVGDIRVVYTTSYIHNPDAFGHIVLVTSLNPLRVCFVTNEPESNDPGLIRLKTLMGRKDLYLMPGTDRPFPLSKLKHASKLDELDSEFELPRNLLQYALKNPSTTEIQYRNTHDIDKFAHEATDEA